MEIASVISTKGGPGKTTVTANLGAFCAEAGLKTLLLDLDTQPSLSSFYPLLHEAPGGSYQLIAFNDANPANVISRSEIDNLSLIVSNDPNNQLPNLLLHAADGRLRLKNLIQYFASDYDLMLIDTQGARSVLLEMALLCSNLAISPVTPDMLAAREFRRGTLQLITDLAPYAQYGLEIPPVSIVVNKLDSTSDARLIHASLIATFTGHPQIKVLNSTLPAAISFRNAATRGIPVHRLEYHQPANRRSPSALHIIRNLAIETFPQWRDRFEAVTEEAVAKLVKEDRSNG
ncbi:ParA family protein [Azotobacter salinestris]|uniref:ParA family protein n=1 Tax=Azotobacter salinestris TaxID=69964 RepID=UPI0032DE3728